jgi:hypothetical protein
MFYSTDPWSHFVELPKSGLDVHQNGFCIVTIRVPLLTLDLPENTLKRPTPSCGRRIIKSLISLTLVRSAAETEHPAEEAVRGRTQVSPEDRGQLGCRHSKILGLYRANYWYTVFIEYFLFLEICLMNALSVEN